MAKQISNHWAICLQDGSVLYDNFGRAHIYESRAAATNVSQELPERTHVEKVAVQ